MSYPEPIRLKISKTASGTYYIPSIPSKLLKQLAKKHKRRWYITKNGKTLVLQGE